MISEYDRIDYHDELMFRILVPCILGLLIKFLDAIGKLLTIMSTAHLKRMSLPPGTSMTKSDATTMREKCLNFLLEQLKVCPVLNFCM